MRSCSTYLALGLLIGSLSGIPTSAQEAPSEAAAEVLEAEDLGVSLARIQQRLDRAPEGEEARRALRLNYYIQVYAQAPRLELLHGFDVQNSPIPYGAPLHNEMLEVMRPNELYPSAVNLNPILGWTWRALQP